MSDGSKGAAYVGFSSAGALDEHDEDDDGRADDDKGNGKTEEVDGVAGVAGVAASLTKWSSVASLALAWLCSSSLSCSLVVATDLRPKWPPHWIQQRPEKGHLSIHHRLFDCVGRTSRVLAPAAPIGLARVEMCRAPASNLARDDCIDEVSGKSRKWRRSNK